MSYEIIYRGQRTGLPAGVLSDEEFRMIESQDHCLKYGSTFVLTRRCLGPVKCEPDCWPDGVLRSFMDSCDPRQSVLAELFMFWKVKNRVERFRLLSERVESETHAHA